MSNLENGFLGRLERFLADERGASHRFFHRLQELGRPFLLRSDLQDAFVAVCAEEGGAVLSESPLARLVGWAQEAVVEGAWVHVAVRTRVARWGYLSFDRDTLVPAEIGVSAYLRCKERLVEGRGEADGWTLEVDLEPFSREFAKMTETRSIGRGVEFLNRRLSSRLFEPRGEGDRLLLDFLRVHRRGDRQLMLDRGVADVAALRAALREADDLLEGKPDDTPWSDLRRRPARAGFRARLGPRRRRRARDHAAVAGPAGSPLARRPGALPGAHPHDLLHRHHLAPRLVRPVGRAGPARHRRPGGLHPGPGARPRARDAHAAGGPGPGPGAGDPGGHPPDPRGRGHHLRPAPRAHRRHPGRAHPAGAVPRPRRRGHPPLDLALRDLALPGAVRPGRRARAAGRAGRPPRPGDRQLLRRQPGGLAAVPAAGGHPVQHRPRPGEDEVPAVGPLLARPGRPVPLRLPVHGRPDRHEHGRLHHRLHLPGDRRHRPTPSASTRPTNRSPCPASTAWCTASTCSIPSSTSSRRAPTRPCTSRPPTRPAV